MSLVDAEMFDKKLSQSRSNADERTSMACCI